MATPEDAKARARNAYNAAADRYDDTANGFWDRFGRRTVERLDPPPGSRVLDVCCGSGASAIPAAIRAGPSGSVFAVDLAENLLALGRDKAARLGLTNIEFHAADMLGLNLPDGGFDAVVCVFGIFFVPDAVSATRGLWRMVRPGGSLAITTWGPDLFEPLNTFFWQSVREVHAELYKGFNPWDRFCTPDAVRALFNEAGTTGPEVVAESGWHGIDGPADWWTIISGSGYRGTIEQLDAAARTRVRDASLAFVEREAIKRVQANVVYAIARKR